MISAKLGHFLDKPLRPFIRRINISPNLLTITGFVITLLAAAAIPLNIRIGGVIIIIGGIFDALDGVVARINNRVSSFGAFLDSLLDRFSDAALFIAIAVFFYRYGNMTYALLSLVALAGAHGVSYARARAEGLGYECKTGIMERAERIALLTLGCLIPRIMTYLIWVVLLGSYITVIQRIAYIQRLNRK